MHDVVACSTKIRVLCVDDHTSLPEMLGLCIAAEPDMVSVGSLHTADDLTAEVERTNADVVLLDLSMPGKDPLDAVRELAAARRNGVGGRRSVGGAHVIAFSGRSDQRALTSAIEAGVKGYVSKIAEISSVLRAIREVAHGNTAFGER